MGVILSTHGRQRARERLGLKRKAVQRAVDTAWARGVPSTHVRRAVESNMTTREWRGAVFVFSVTEVAVTLVTVLPAKVIDENLAGYRAHRFYQEQRAERRVRRRGRRGSGGETWRSSTPETASGRAWSR